MAVVNTLLATLIGYALLASAHPGQSSQHSHVARKTSPQNICGPASGFSCDPASPNGGPCCSHAGYCGPTKAYCGTGCQPGFGKCDGDSSSVPKPINNDPLKPAPKNPPSGPAKNPPTDPPTSTPPSSNPNGVSPPATKDGSCYTLPDNPAARFRHHALYTFTTPTLPAGLSISNNPPIKDPDAPYSHEMVSSNVAIHPPYVHLTVPGAQTRSPITGAEIHTAYKLKHASVRTTAIFSPVQGVCHGLFYYASDTQETDIEYLTSPASTSNPAGTSPNNLPLHFTNQPVDGVHAHHTYAQGAPPADITTREHEYRIDWTKGENLFFTDGKLVERFDGPNVPTGPGTWLWNNWANGGRGWSVGPPKEDSVLRISRIEIWYNGEGEEDC